MWNIIFFLIRYLPTIIEFIKWVLERTENKKEAKQCIGAFCELKENELGPFLEMLRRRREKNGG
jgi:hypothetical protein